MFGNSVTDGIVSGKSYTHLVWEAMGMGQAFTELYLGHTLGLKLHVDAATTSAKRCLVDVDRWDFHWQNAWWYAEPLTLDLFKSVNISCTYDTRGRTTPVTWGEGTSDEMCLAYLYATAP